MENRNWKKFAIILLIILSLSIGYLAGYSKGSYDGAKFAISVGMHFIDIDFNQDELIRLINLYKVHCNGSFYADCIDDIGT